jgi:hypothetical protein
MTELDQAYAAMQADEAAGLRFYQLLADATLYLLLEAEAAGEVVSPKVIALEAGDVLLAFDREERLAAFAGGPGAYAALPGRIIAQQMVAQGGLSLGLNIGTGAASEVLLPPEAMVWLCEMLGAGPEAGEARPEMFTPAQGLPAALITALEQAMVAASGLAAAGLLAGVRYAGGQVGHVFAFVNALPSAEAALARAVSEALVFSGIEAGQLDVTFLHEGDAALDVLARVARVFEVPERLPERVVEPVRGPAAPGMDPGVPPKLR